MRKNPAFTEELRRFAGLFDSEDKLREQVAAVLSKVPGVTGVRITHGSQELGKDIVFFAQAGLDERALYACVVKNGRITGSADSNRGARTVVNQAEQALDTPYTHVDGRKLIPAKVYVITPHDSPQSTLNSISEKLRHLAGRVEFLMGPDLLALFKKYGAEFFFLQGDLLGVYLSALKRIVEKDTEIANIAFQTDLLLSATRGLAERYVRPRLQVVIRQFDFTYVVPDEVNINRGLFRSDLKRLHHSALILIALLETSGFQQALADKAPPNRVNDASVKLRMLLSELTRGWESGLDNLRGTGIARALRGDLMAVRIGSDSLKAEWQTIIERSKIWIEEFRTVVSRLNVNSKGATKDFLKWLDETARTKYFCVADAAQLSTSSILRSRSQEVITLPPHLTETSRRSFLITGPAGYGKTSFCRYNTMCDIAKLLSEESDRIPIYVPLHRLAQQQVATLADIIRYSTDNEDCVLDIPTIVERPLRIYLDGLDEIPAYDRQGQIIQVVRDATSKMPDVQVIVTGRDYVSGPWLSWLARISIAEFTDAEIREFVLKSTGRDERTAAEFFSQVESVVNLKQLLRVPLLATLTLSIYSRMGGTSKLPDSKGKLYELFVHLLCGGWDDAKKVQRHGQYGSEIKKQVLTLLAATLHESKRRDCTSHDFQNVMQRMAPRLISQWPTMLDDLLKDGLLISVGPSYAFAHHSFQEYLTAKELLTTSPDRSTDRLHWYFQGDDWWKEVLSFYIGLLQNPADVEQWILRGEREVSAMVGKSWDIYERGQFLRQRLLATFGGYELTDRIR